ALADQLLDGWHLPAFFVALLKSCISVLQLCPVHVPRDRVCRMRPPRRFSLGFVDTRIGPACRHACGIFEGQVRNAPYLPGTIVHNTRAGAALQTHARGPNPRSALASDSALRASAHLIPMRFAQALI